MVRYSKEQKIEILQQRQEGESIRNFAKRVGISEASIYNWLKADLGCKGKFEPISIIHNSPVPFDTFIQIRVGDTEISISQYVKPDYIKMLLGW